MHGESNEMNRLKAAIHREYEDDPHAPTLHNPKNTQTVKLHFRGEKIAKVSWLNDNNNYFKRELMKSLLNSKLKLDDKLSNYLVENDEDLLNLLNVFNFKNKDYINQISSGIRFSEESDFRDLNFLNLFDDDNGKVQQEQQQQLQTTIDETKSNSLQILSSSESNSSSSNSSSSSSSSSDANESNSFCFLDFSDVEQMETDNNENELRDDSNYLSDSDHLIAEDNSDDENSNSLLFDDYSDEEIEIECENDSQLSDAYE